MSSVQVPPNPAHVESKTAKKKKAKATVTAESPAPSDTHPSSATVDAVANGADVPNESPIIRELKKNIRNVKKKLNATQKVDSIIAENPGASLDDLLTSKKINADQKVQAQKKPGLEKQLVQFQEQVAQYLQVDAEYQKRAVEEKTALQATHQEELAKVKEEAINEAAAESSKQAKDNLLILSKFLRAAAAKRQNGDETSAENRAFEGALLLVYGGDSNAVAAIESLISGSGEKVITVDGLPSEFTYKQVQELSNDYTPYSAEEAWAEEVAQSDPTAPATTSDEAPHQAQDTTGTDPTVAHAGLTEIDASTTGPAQTNGVAAGSNHLSHPAASAIDSAAANATGAGENWGAKSVDTGAATAGSTEDWVQVDRDPAETDTGTNNTIAGTGGTQSWAEDLPTVQEAQMPEPAYLKQGAPDVAVRGGGDAAEEFKEVRHHGHHRGRSRGGAGEFRGEGRGRGRGYRGDRGDGSGRGRGGFRGDRERGGRGGRGRGEGGGYRGRGGRGGAGAGAGGWGTESAVAPAAPAAPVSQDTKDGGR